MSTGRRSSLDVHTAPRPLDLAAEVEAASPPLRFVSQPRAEKAAALPPPSGALWGIALLAIIALASLATGAAADPRIAAVAGVVEVSPPDGEAWSPAIPAAALRQGDRLRTGPAGWVQVAFDDASLVVLGGGTTVRFDDVGAGGARTLVRVGRGRVRVVTADGRAAGRFEVETPTAVTSGRGNEYVVAYDAASAETQVIGTTGSLEVRSVLGVMGQPVSLTPGVRTTVHRGAFPKDPTDVPSMTLAALEPPLKPPVSTEDSLLSTFTGAGTRAVRDALRSEAPPPAAPEFDSLPALDEPLPPAAPEKRTRPWVPWRGEVTDDGLRR
jgi:hypothetical protein